MRQGSIALAMLLGGSLAFAATSTVCPAPGASATTSVTVPYTPSGMATGVTDVTTPVTTAAASCPNISSDTACIINEMRSMRGDMKAMALEVRGQMLISQMNDLMAREMVYRQQLAINPNMPGAQTTAQQLAADAEMINTQSAAFARELSMVPPDQRPYIASQLNTFDVVYWTPAQQRFAEYRTQFLANAPTAYQPAVVANTWLPAWQSRYQTALSNYTPTQQQFATINWWSGQRVLGVQETMGVPGGTTLMLPAGSVIYIPASSVPYVGSTGTMIVPGSVTVTNTTGTVVCPPNR